MIPTVVAKFPARTSYIRSNPFGRSLTGNVHSKSPSRAFGNPGSILRKSCRTFSGLQSVACSSTNINQQLDLIKKLSLKNGPSPILLDPTAWMQNVNQAQSDFEALFGLDSNSAALSSTKLPSTAPTILKEDYWRYFEFKEAIQSGTKTFSSLDASPISEESKQTTNYLVASSVALKDYNFMFKILDYISDGRWSLATSQTYFPVIKSLLRSDSSQADVDMAFRVFNNYISKHPQFRTPNMRSIAFFFTSRLSKIQAPRALQLHQKLRTQFSTVPASPLTNFVEGLYWLDILSTFPHPRLAIRYGRKLRNRITFLKDKSQQLIAQSQIVYAVIKSLLKCGKVDEAASLLQPKELFSLEHSQSTGFFRAAFVDVVTCYAELGNVSQVKKMLSAVSTPTFGNLFSTQLKFELLLQAHAHAQKSVPITTQQALELLAKMGKVSTVTTKACNHVLMLAFGNSKLTKEEMIELRSVLETEYGFVPNAETFNILIKMANPESKLEHFYEACSYGQTNPSSYGMIFSKVFGTIQPTQTSKFRLQSLISQMEASNLSWTIESFNGAMKAFKNHGMWDEMVRFFKRELDAGKISLDSESANLAISACLKLDSPDRDFINTLFKSMHTTKLFLHGEDQKTVQDVPTSDRSLLFSLADRLLSKPSMKKRPTRKLWPAQSENVQLTAFHPNMIPDIKTFELISVLDGHDERFINTISSAPYNLVPTLKTFKHTAYYCLRNRKAESLILILLKMVEAHPTQVPDELITSSVAFLTSVGKIHLLKPIKSKLEQTKIRLPETVFNKEL